MSLLPLDIVDVIASVTSDLRLRRIITISNRQTVKGLRKIEYNPFIAAKNNDIYSIEHAAVVFGAPSGLYVLRKFFQQVILFGHCASDFFKAANPNIIKWMMKRRIFSPSLLNSHDPESGRFYGLLMNAKDIVSLANILILCYAGDRGLMRTIGEVRTLFRYGKIKKGAGHMGFPEIYCFTKTPSQAIGTFSGELLRNSEPRTVRRLISDGQEMLDKNIGVYLACRYAAENSATKLLRHRHNFMTKKELFKLIDEQRVAWPKNNPL